MPCASATALFNFSRLFWIVCIGNAAGIRDVEAFACFRIPIEVGAIVSVLHLVPNFVAIADVTVGSAAASKRNIQLQKLST